jgi:hypothetical protein
MTKEEMIAFIKTNHCDIETCPVSNILGQLPPPQRQLNEGQLKELLEKAELLLGYKFAFFLEMNMAGAKKNITEQGFERICWIDHATWNGMYNHWLGVEQNWSEENYRAYKNEKDYQAPDED